MGNYVGDVEVGIGVKQRVVRSSFMVGKECGCYGHSDDRPDERVVEGDKSV